MDLINQKVLHKAFGEGIVVAQDGTLLTVSFGGMEKSFRYPDSFENFLEAEDEALAATIKSELQKINSDKMEIEEQKRFHDEQIRERLKKLEEPVHPHLKSVLGGKTDSQKKSSSSLQADSRSIAFKCNFCDGGKVEAECIGYSGICSDKMIKYNIKDAKRSRCVAEDCKCLKYFNGEISREELDKSADDDTFMCYESSLSKDWRIGAGVTQTGENAGASRKISKIVKDSLAVLTTTLPKSEESMRIIFAVFLVDSVAAGDDSSEGTVSASSAYRIMLTPEEAVKIRFWNYYANKTASRKPMWGSGVFRYIDCETSALILRDIADIKKGKDDEADAISLFDYYCRINCINPAELGAPSGTLTQTTEAE